MRNIMDSIKAVESISWEEEEKEEEIEHGGGVMEEKGYEVRGEAGGGGEGEGSLWWELGCRVGGGRATDERFQWACVHLGE